MEPPTPRHALRIPPGEAQSLQRIFALPPSIAGRFRLVRIAVDGSMITALYWTPHGPARISARVVLADDTAPSNLASAFELNVKAPRVEERDALQAVVEARIARVAPHLLWVGAALEPRVMHTGTDIERVAFVAGLKPAIRTVLHEADLRSEMHWYRSRGFATRSRACPPDVSLSGGTILYVARDSDGARHLEELEDNVLAPGLCVDRATDDFLACVTAAQEALGMALGYPRCCTRAFSERAKAAHLTGRQDDDDLYDALTYDVSDRPYARLNVALAPSAPAYASFIPCQPDCPEARKLVDAIASAIAPAHRAELDATLAKLVGVDAQGRRYVMRVAEHDPHTIEECVRVSPAGATTNDALARGYVRASIDARHRVVVDGHPTLVVIDFRNRAGE